MPEYLPVECMECGGGLKFMLGGDAARRVIAAPRGMKCPKCDRRMEQEEKDTSSGRDMPSTMGLLFGNFYLTRERRSQPRGSITRWRSDFLQRRDSADGGGFGETHGEHPCELPDPSCYALASACG